MGHRPILMIGKMLNATNHTIVIINKTNTVGSQSFKREKKTLPMLTSKAVHLSTLVSVGRN